MRIQIKTDPETLFLIHTAIKNAAANIHPINIPCRVHKSQCQELFEILSRRCMAYTLNPNGKAVSFTVRYHLAQLIYETTCEHQKTFGHFEANKLEILKNNLHKLLL